MNRPSLGLLKRYTHDGVLVTEYDLMDSWFHGGRAGTTDDGKGTDSEEPAELRLGNM